jgi:hypothetical protein
LHDYIKESVGLDRGAKPSMSERGGLHDHDASAEESHQMCISLSARMARSAAIVTMWRAACQATTGKRPQERDPPRLGFHIAEEAEGRLAGPTARA